MKTCKPMLFYLLVTLLACCLVPGVALGDGPWDIDFQNSSTSGGGTVHDRNAVTSDEEFDAGGDESGDGPSMVAAVTYYWLNRLGFVNLAETMLVKDSNERSAKERRADNATRR